MLRRASQAVPVVLQQATLGTQNAGARQCCQGGSCLLLPPRLCDSLLESQGGPDSAMLAPS